MTRNIYINNEIPFKELENYTFKFNSSWRIQTLGTDKEAFKFYFEAGKEYEFSMETSLGSYGPKIAQIENVISNLSKIYREILVFTGPEPDPNRDYQLTTRVPNLISRLNAELEELHKIRDKIIEISGSKSEKTGILDTIILQIEDFLKKPSQIHKKLTTFNNNVSSLGTLIILLSDQPLELDYIAVHGSDGKLPKNSVNIFKQMFFSIRAFFASFTTDYSSVGKTTKDANETINVWLTVGKDQANILRKLIDEKFTPMHDIQVDLKLVSSASLLPATSSGKGPDVAMGVGTNVPVNYALRNASYDLTKFSDFKDIIKRFNRSAYESFEFGDGTYALPEQEIFMMMFYRTDIFDELGLNVPNTWQDVIKMIPDLQKYNLEFFLPVPRTQGAVVNLPPNPIFSTMFYQNGGSFYINNNTESGFNEGLGPEVFETWTQFYTDYSFPVEANFANRFRSGQMPLGITYYNTYNTLSVFAPEIRGKWGFLPVPGTEYIDENGEKQIRRDTVSTNTGAMILNNSSKKDASWEFLKWWTSTDTQVRFGREMEGILGAAARYPTANVEAFESLPWKRNELEVLKEQWSWVRGIPEVPGSYMTGRHLDNAFRMVINETANPREVIYDYVQIINEEINKKRKEFNLN
ncbi:extracellular solute-binding protein [Haploplasma axanthum]|uniref:Maltose-binding periplasmic proteins/domains n=1 Tax=Haploplasma axanthum TaxID=29552 RepID=A0A449BCY2_HAPAX|nr:extracellular solute-binding protein [Haploplasma axanthum]VEU80296.1 Maltose-binding periplasmic proteins/domains [Haploplasma axanthum]